jgi:hypothetical protein
MMAIRNMMTSVTMSRNAMKHNDEHRSTTCHCSIRSCSICRRVWRNSPLRNSLSRAHRPVSRAICRCSIHLIYHCMIRSIYQHVICHPVQFAVASRCCLIRSIYDSPSCAGLPLCNSPSLVLLLN